MAGDKRQNVSIPATSNANLALLFMFITTFY